ncbi:lamina-associated polypeptide 2-like [Ranitomeya imitator]|uniref:lamina-associated polypeptide 2-like n=1 Tax=Ranitomeya imitator TaxID=111125 RepID=UPI0037E741B5
MSSPSKSVDPAGEPSSRRSSDASRRGEATDSRSRKTLQQPDPAKRRQKSKHKQCALCDEPLPDAHPKKLCNQCITETMQSQSMSVTDIRAIIREELQAITQASAPPKKSSKEKAVSSSESDEEGVIHSDSSRSSSSSSTQSDIGGRACFPLDGVDNLVKSIRNTIGCEDAKDDQTAQDIMFAGLAERKRRAFPVIPAVKALIRREWEKQDQRGFLPSASKRKYPFSDEELNTWTKIPKVDAAVASTSKQSALPVEDAGLLSDPLDRKAESSLKRSWEASTGIFKPTIASTCTARSMLVWIDQLDQQIEQGISRQKLRDALPLIRGAAAFMADASADSLRLAARSAGLVNNARRALWMKSWKGDTHSKAKICGIPCEGEFLFGKALDDILKKAKERKKAFPDPSIPFYRKTFRRRPFGK